MLPRYAQAAAGAVARNLFEKGGEIPQERLVWMLDDVDDFVARAGKKVRFIFLLVLFALEWIFPLVFTRRLSRFSRLDREVQLTCMTRLEASELAGALLLVKAFLGLIYFEHPDVMDEIGFDRKPLVEIGAPQ